MWKSCVLAPDRLHHSKFLQNAAVQLKKNVTRVSSKPSTQLELTVFAVALTYCIEITINFSLKTKKNLAQMAEYHYNSYNCLQAFGYLFIFFSEDVIIVP